MQVHPMPEFGSLCLLLALGLTAYNLLIGGIALWGESPSGLRITGIPQSRWNRLGETARRAGIASFIALCCAAFALVWAAFTDDFSVAYIASHSNRALNPAYKFAALWSGQEGSLLLWAFLLSAYGFVLRLRLLPAPPPPRRCPPSRLCLDHPGRHPDVLRPSAGGRRASLLHQPRRHP